MAKGAPKGGKPGKVVGYGKKGGEFKSQKNYNQSMEGQRHAKNPALSVKPVGTGAKGNKFFSKAAFNASKSGPTHAKTGTPGIGHPAPPHVPMPGHPSQNPTHIHGPAAVAPIKSGGAPQKGAGSGTVATRAPKGLPGRTAGGGGRL